jgi:hypothetical protein
MYRREVAQRLWPRLRDDDLVLDLGLNVRLALSPGAAGVALPTVDFVMLSHPRQNTEALASAVWPQTDAALTRMAAELGRDRRRRRIARSRSNWLTVWARTLAASGDVRAARRVLLRAVAARPSNRWAWSQLVQALLSPSRLRGR